MPELRKIMNALEKLAPGYLAESWDHVGLMVGDPAATVNKILCALDVNEEVIEEAVSQWADCIVTHHPFLFKPLTQLDFSSVKGRMIRKLMENQIAVYAMHTNYDIAEGGLNDYLAEGLGLQEIKILSPTYTQHFCKVVIYVPGTHLEAVRQVIIDEGKAEIGRYKGCTFTVAGEGSFVPLSGSQPFIGEEGRLSLTDEKMISFMAAEEEVDSLIEKIRAVHPYEEMAYDVFRLENIKKHYGLGRYGRLKKAVPLGALLEEIKTFFNIQYLRVSEQDEQKMIETIALCSGEGSEFMTDAAKVAQLYITGDAKFHQAQLARELGLVLVDVGHYASENRALEPIVKCLTKNFETCEVIYSEVNGETLFIR